MNRKDVVYSLGHALGVLGYIVMIATFFFNIARLGGPDKTVLIPIFMLLLFVISATIVGSLVLGKPIILYADGQKQRALTFFGYTLGWMILIMFIVFMIYFSL